MARWFLLTCLVVLLGASVCGCSAPARLVTHPATPSPAAGRTIESQTQTEVAPAPAMPHEAQAEQPSDGPTPEQSRKGQILVAAVLVLAAIVLIAATI
jgi:hypothetical protein